jgi:hypothetical protein
MRIGFVSVEQHNLASVLRRSYYRMTFCSSILSRADSQRRSFFRIALYAKPIWLPPGSEEANAVPWLLLVRC